MDFIISFNKSIKNHVKLTLIICHDGYVNLYVTILTLK